MGTFVEHKRAPSLSLISGDPAHYGWELADINHLSVACAAANAILWGLGDHVLVYRADTLAPGDHRADAVSTRAQVLEHHRGVVRAARLAALLTRQATPASTGTSLTAAAAS